MSGSGEGLKYSWLTSFYFNCVLFQVLPGNTEDYVPETGHPLISCGCFIEKNVP